MTKTSNLQSRINNLLKKPNAIFFLVALISSLVIWGVFVGQFLELGFSTIEYGASDSGIGSYPGFCKIVKIIKSNMELVGVDVQTLNGASEFYLRPNMPNAYMPMYLFAMLSFWIPTNWAYWSFLLFSTIIGMFYSQKIVYHYANATIKESILFGYAMCALMICEEPILLWFIVLSILPVACYYSLKAIYYPSLKSYIEAILAFVLAFTTGYMNVSFVMVVFIFLFTIIYYYLREKDKTIKKYIKYTSAAVIAGVICLPYYYAMLQYILKTHGIDTAFSDALLYKVDILDLFYIFSYWSIKPEASTNAIEQISLMTLGFIGVFVLAFAFFTGSLKKLEKKQKKFLTGVSCYYVFMLLWALEDATPLTYWAYYYLPVIGSMHMPMRWMILFNFVLYIAIGMVYRYCDFEKYEKTLKVLVSALIISLAVIIFLHKMKIDIPFLILDRFVIEIVLFTLFLICIIQYGKNSCITLIIWAATLLYPAVMGLYREHDLSAADYEINSNNMYYNEIANENIDQIVDDIEKKEIYKYVAVDDTLIFYLLNNYPWMNDKDYVLSNYWGYAIHLNAFDDYQKKFPWFDSIDWRYVADTRADFVIVDRGQYIANKSVLDQIIDFSKNPYDMGEERIAYRLKKFIPSYFVGNEYVEDDSSSLDNGYFYSAELNNDSIIDFETNNSNYFKITVNAKTDAVGSFLLYSAPNYKFYIDGVEFEPDIYQSQAYFVFHEGTHTIEVRYKNAVASLSVWIFIFAYTVLIGGYLCCVFKEYYVQKKNGGRNNG